MAIQRTTPCPVFLFGACLLLIALFAQASAQTNKGTIKGTVKDQSGAVIQNATVTVLNVATNEERTASTGDDGNYQVPLLDPGTYKVTVKAASFPETVQENVAVQTSTTSVIVITLNAGVGTQTVTITAAPSVVESETSDRGSVIIGKQVTDLPIPQRTLKPRPVEILVRRAAFRSTCLQYLPP